MQENEHILYKIGNALGRLHGRPIGERRALFFATFAVAVSLVFSMWARHMYQRFGVVFSPGAVRRVEQERRTPQTAEENTAPAPLTPFAVLRENLAILRSGSVSFFSEAFSLLEQSSEAIVAADGVGEKLPPVLGVQEETSSEVRPSPEDLGNGSSLIIERNEKGIAPSEIAAPVFVAVDLDSSVAADDARAVDAQEGSKDGQKVVFVEVPAEETMAVIQTAADQPPAATFSFYDVLKHNFEAIRRGAADFYEYLTR